MAMRSLVFRQCGEKVSSAVSRSAERIDIRYVSSEAARVTDVMPARVYRHEYGTGSSGNALGAITAAIAATTSFWYLKEQESFTSTQSLKLLSTSERTSLPVPSQGLLRLTGSRSHNKESSNERTDVEHKYDIDWQTVLGEGSYGSVHPAVNTSTGEKVALKRISKRTTDLSLFNSETVALHRVNGNGGHPNVCALQDVYEDYKYFYLITELIPGVEMFEDVVKNGAYSEIDASRLIKDTALALAFLHRIGIVHSDVKPENLMISSKNRKDGRVKMIDFGSAHLDYEESSGSRTSTQKREGPQRADNYGTTGTAAYWAPERFVDGAVADTASDMWSVGIILFIMLTGAHPFDVEGTLTDNEIEEVIKADPTPPIHSEITSHLSPAALDLIQKLMTKDPSKRMTAEEMIQHPWIRGECFQ